jgi:hypothetical protein
MMQLECKQVGWIHWYNLLKGVWAASLAEFDHGSMEDESGNLLDDDGPFAPRNDIKPALNHGDPGTKPLGCPEDPVIPIRRKDGMFIK